MGLRHSIGFKSHGVDVDAENFNPRYICMSKSKSAGRPSSATAITPSNHYEQLFGCQSFIDGEYRTDVEQSLKEPVGSESDEGTSPGFLCCNICVLKRKHKGYSKSKKSFLYPAYRQSGQFPSTESNVSGKVLVIASPETADGELSCILVKTQPDGEGLLHPFRASSPNENDIEVPDVNFTHGAAVGDFVIHCGTKESEIDGNQPCESKTENQKRSGPANGFTGFSLFSRAFNRKSDVVDEYPDVEARLLGDGQEIIGTGFSNSASAAVSDGLSLNGSAQNDYEGCNLSYGSAPIARFDSTLSVAIDDLDDSIECHRRTSMSTSFIRPTIDDEGCTTINNIEVDKLVRYPTQCMSHLNQNGSRLVDSNTSFDAPASMDDSMLLSTVRTSRLIEDDTFLTSLLEDVGDCRSLLISLEEILEQNADDPTGVEEALQSAILEDNVAYRRKIVELRDLIGEQQEVIDQLKQRFETVQKCRIGVVRAADLEE